VVGSLLVELLHELVVLVRPGAWDDIGHLPTIDLVELMPKRLHGRLVHCLNLPNGVKVPGDLDDRVILIEERQRLVQTPCDRIVQVLVLPLVMRVRLLYQKLPILGRVRHHTEEPTVHLQRLHVLVIDLQ
jgi:hypothetical protein